MLTRREIAAAVTSAVVTLGAVAAWGEAPAKSVQGSAAFDWGSLQGNPTEVGTYSQVLRSPTRTLDELEIHVTRLDAGKTSHAPHRHANEELVIVKEGTLEALVNGKRVRLTPGSVIFNASGDLHAVWNVGDGPAVYHVINWSSPSPAEATAKTSAAKSSPAQAH